MKKDDRRNIIAPTESRAWKAMGSFVLNFSIDMLKAANVPGRDALIMGST